MDETKLFQLAQGGNGTALGTLLEPRYMGAVRAAQAIVRDEEIAKEIAQESLMRLMQYLPTLQNAEALGLLFTTICLNRARNTVRVGQDKRRPRLAQDKMDQLPDEDPTAEETAVHADLLAKLRAAAGELDPKKRRVFELRYTQGRTPQEIAKELGLRPTQVYEILREAREELAEKLGPKEGQGAPPGGKKERKEP